MTTRAEQRRHNAMSRKMKRTFYRSESGVVLMRRPFLPTRALKWYELIGYHWFGMRWFR